MENVLKNIETFYTGGGVWLTACPISEKHYYIVDEEYGCLSFYNDGGENDTDYPCERMVWSKSEDELTQRQKVLYHEMKADLFRRAW